MKVKGMIESDVDTFKVGDVIEVKLADGVKVQAMAVQEHYPEYRNPKRNFPGCVFLVGKHTHVMQGTSGSHNGKADGYYDTNGNSYSSGECKFVAKNEGIVFA